MTAQTSLVKDSADVPAASLYHDAQQKRMSTSSLPGLLSETGTSPASSLRAASVHTTTIRADKTTTTTSTTTTTLKSVARQKRQSWMRSSVVRRAATVVDEEVAALSEKSPFLNSLSNNNNNDEVNIALFQRSELQLGKALGRGGFAEVYAVAGFDLKDDDVSLFYDKQTIQRKTCRASAITSSGRPAYAVKFLRKKLLNNTREFQHAAIDLAVESKYLAALNHDNIVKVRGLVQGGTAAFRTGKHDDFFIIMDHLQETLDHRIQRWQARNEKGAHPPQEYFHRTLKYCHQVADALAYLHAKDIVYRDLKPSNLGFKSRNVIQLFDFGLCRELPKRKGQTHAEEDLEDEETFHMSGVGTQRYMAPEILTERRYNLKADVYSFSMVALEMLTWIKPFADFTPEEHQLNVANFGERPQLLENIDDACSKHTGADDEVAGQRQSNNVDGASVAKEGKRKAKRKRTRAVLVKHWPEGIADLLREAWAQDVGVRLTMQSVLTRISHIMIEFNEQEQTVAATAPLLDGSNGSSETKKDNNEVVLEFPSHFSSIYQLQDRDRLYEEQQRQQDCMTTTGDDSCSWFEDRRSEMSNSLLALTITSASTTLHDSTSIDSSSAAAAMPPMSEGVP